MQIRRAQCLEKAFEAYVKTIVAYGKERQSKRSYEPTFIDKDMKGVDEPHNNVLVLTVNINTFNVKMILINPGSSS